MNFYISNDIDNIMLGIITQEFSSVFSYCPCLKNSWISTKLHISNDVGNILTCHF